MSTDTSRGEKALQSLRPVRVYHPMLLALIPLCGLFAQNAGLLPVSALVRPGAFLTGTALLLWMVFSFLCGNRYHGGLLASAVIIPLFVVWGVLEDVVRFIIPFYASAAPGLFYAGFGVAAIALIVVAAYLNRKEPKKLRNAVLLTTGSLVIGLVIATFLLAPIFGRRAAWLIAAYLVTMGAAVLRVWHYPGDLQLTTRSLNWFALILLALYGAVLVVNRAPEPALAPPALTIAQPADASTGELPDIYVIALDGYARSDVLRSGYAYNNLPFEEEMKGLGFQFADHSISNYPQAVLSLTALLNMDYLDKLLPANISPQQAGMGHVFHLYHNNRLFDLVRERGYEVYSFSPGLESIEPRSADVIRLAPERALGEFEMVLSDRIFTSRVMQAYYYVRYDNPAYWRYAFRRTRILYAFNEMARIANESSSTPRLIFANLLIPEPPYLFTRGGGRAQPFGPGSLGSDRFFRGREAEYRLSYLDQIHFLNERLADTARRIIDTSKRPAIVLILSSRGAPPATDLKAGAADERFANLLLVRFPKAESGPETSLDADISLVNVLRVTLNRALDAQLPLLPDQKFVSSEEQPFAAQPVGS